MQDQIAESQFRFEVFQIEMLRRGASEEYRGVAVFDALKEHVDIVEGNMRVI